VRRLIPFFVLLALLIAPYGRAEAQSAAHDMPAMAGHCDPVPPSAPPPVHHRSIDCMIACAGVPMLEANLIAPPLPPLAMRVAAPVRALHGILPQFDPPPPRSLS
jgi:hypothetical protein